MSLQTIINGKIVTVPSGYASAKFLTSSKPISINVTGTGAAPAAETVQATYTVPSNKFAVLHSAQAINRIDTAATTSGVKRMRVRANNGADTTIVCSTFLSPSQNTIGNEDKISVSPNLILIPGNTVTITNQDGSTEGTTSFFINVGIMEYDL